MKAMKFVAILALACFSAQLLTGCTTVKPIKKGLPPEQLVERIHQGDRVIIHTKDVAKYEVVVESINTNEIIGNDKVFKLDEIEEIYIEEVSVLKTTGAVAGVYVVWLGLLAFAVYAGIAIIGGGL